MNKNFNNIDIEEKRKIFLEELSKHEKDILEFEKFSGPGIKRKIQRLIYSPKNYLPYISRKIFRNFFNDKTIKLFYGKELLIDNKDDEASRLVEFKTLGGEAELRLTKFFIKNLDQGDIFYDIGANYGFYTCLAAEFCKEVHSFEPVPAIFNYLKKNAEEYSNILLNNLAISDKNGITEMYLDKKCSGLSTLNTKIAEKPTFDLSNKLKIQSITLDKYANDYSHPTVIKMDIEGGEKIAIEGGEKILKNESPIIAMEVWSKDNNGEISMEAVEKLRDLGYKSYSINSSGDLIKVDGNLIENFELNSFSNFIFKK
ncbi:MAG TPA: FkbM family methyltransferase [Candidatus Pacearchaeota archaeon]|nr:FkbM family methyltransferase [Candidatus Pacearchaeota archaeon]